MLVGYTKELILTMRNKYELNLTISILTALMVLILMIFGDIMLKLF